MNDESEVLALGHYTRAVRQIEALRHQRGGVVMKITALIAPGKPGAQGTKPIDMARYDQNSEELRRLNADLMAAVETANEWAGLAGEPLIR